MTPCGAHLRPIRRLLREFESFTRAYPRSPDDPGRIGRRSPIGPRYRAIRSGGDVSRSETRRNPGLAAFPRSAWAQAIGWHDIRCGAPGLRACQCAGAGRRSADHVYGAASDGASGPVRLPGVARDPVRSRPASRRERRNRNSIWPLTLRRSSAAQAWSASNVAGSRRSRNGFRAVIGCPGSGCPGSGCQGSGCQGSGCLEAGRADQSRRRPSHVVGRVTSTAPSRRPPNTSPVLRVERPGVDDRLRFVLGAEDDQQVAYHLGLAILVELHDMLRR
jgi:hypothetical protein